MYKHLQKFFVATLLLLLGTMNTAWAATGDVTTNADIDFSNAITGTNPYTIEGTVGKMTWTQQWNMVPNITGGVLRFGNFNGGVVELQNNNIGAKDKVTISFEMAFGKLSGKHVGFKLVDVDGNDQLVQWCDAYNGDFDDANPLNLVWANMYRGSNAALHDRCVYFTIDIDYATKKITTKTKCYLSGTSKPVTEATAESEWNSTAKIAKFVLQGNTNNAERYSTIDNLKITTTEGDYSAATANYTVKFVCNEEEIKEAATYVGDVNSSISVSSADKANFSVDDNTRYIYVSDDSNGKTVANDGSSVVTVTFREAEKWSYSIGTAYNGTPLAFTATGAVWEDQNSITVQYPRFQVSGNELVERAPVNNDLKVSYNVTEDNFSQTLDYVAVNPAITNLYLLKEAEDLETTLPKNATSFTSRVSGGQIIYGASGTLLNLPAGKYIFTLGAIGGDNNTHKVAYTVNAGETQIISDFTVTGNMLALKASEEFMLTEETPITFTCSDPASSRGIDLIYVQKTGDYVAPSTAYTVDFNTAITTSIHDFAVASNWKHIVGAYTDDYGDKYYMSYSYVANEGANGDGDGALLAYRQYASDYSSGTTVQDYLITPVVNGKVTLDIKASTLASSSNAAYVEVYAVNGDGTIGNLIKKISDDIAGANSGSNTEWANFELADLTEAQRIALRCQYVYIDNFKADDATIVPEPKLTITAVTKATDASSIYFNQQADGTLLVQMYVTLQNNGDVDFVAGTTENYTLSVIQKPSYGASHGPYGAFAIPVNLAKGETSEPILVSVSVPAEEVSALSSWSYWYVIENVTSTQSSASLWASFNKYESKFIFREADASSTSSLTTQNWGAINELTTKSFEIANTGSAPLVIKSMAFPAGFNFAIDYDNLPEGITRDSNTGEVTINGGAKLPVVVTVPDTPYGSYSGNFTVTYLNALAEENTEFNCAFSVNVINPNTWTADFNNTTSTILYPEGAIAEAGITNDSQSVSSGNYNNWIKGYTSDSYATANNKFITPKLHANAGDKLSFDVKAGYSTSDAYYVKVYKSTDRVNWGDPVATYVYSTVGSSFTAQSVTFDEAGDYYVAFALYGTGSCVDNIVGLEKVAVAHDLYIKSVTWPDASIKSGASQNKPSIDIIPLTTEAAENYTVKYVCGETVLAETDAKALTASAKSSTSFSFSWAPSVTETTVYEGTKIVFEFTDGTKFETEPFDLTVTNEAIFHFLNSVPANTYYEPTDRTAAISFGKTNEADTQSFVIFNWGSVDLTVNGIQLPAGFTTDAEFPMTVPAFNGVSDGLAASSKTLNITFSATEASDYSGNMVITYSTDKTFTLPISGTKLDPNKWYATFGTESDQWPAGSVYQSNVSTTYVSTGNYSITSSSETNNFFITPKLAAKAGEKLSFDAKLYSSYWSDGAVKVWAAATREELIAKSGTRLKAVSGSDEEGDDTKLTTDFKTFEVTVPESGEYYFGFEISGRPYVDELYGLTPVAVENDIKIASSDVPTEATQNVAATATVNILNFGAAEIAADAYTVNVYVDGEAAGNGTTVAIPASQLYSGNGTQVSASFRTPKIGTFPVYIEVKAGNVTLTTEPVEVTFVEETIKAETAATADGTSSQVPLYLSYYHSESVSLYTSNVLANDYGLSDGAKIKSITYKGYKTVDTHSSTVNVWYEWTDDTEQAKPANGLYATEGMTQLITDQEMTWEKKGSATVLEDFIVLNFDEPLVYQTGKSLRIVMRSNSDAWKSVSFEKSTSSTSKLTYYHNNDTKSTFESNSWSYTVLPVLHLSLDAEPIMLTGTVKNADGNAIEGATVTLTSDDADGVQYTGTSDANGAYTVNVIQATRSFKAVATAKGYKRTAAADVISFNGANQEQNFMMNAVEAVPLEEADGWQEIAKLPTAIDNYYFALADADKNLMLTLARGNHQGGDYNGLYYKTGANAIVDKSMLFTLEAHNDALVMTNAEYNSKFLQTEWNTAWNYRTHDNGGGNKDWGKVKFNFSEADGSWTIQNGQYFEENGNFLGMWDDVDIANGKELALNKGADKKSNFRLYAIKKSAVEAYKANLMNTTGDEPVDMTALIVNPNANYWDGLKIFGWETTGPQSLNMGTGADGFPGLFEYCDWNAGSWTGTLNQTIEVPNGVYELKAAVMASSGVTMYLTANDAKSDNLASFGDNPRFGSTLSVEATVTDGKLTIGAYAKANGTQNWANADNFTLTYLHAIVQPTEEDYYELASAIKVAEIHQPGFFEGEYAPYNNMEAMKALAAAKAIDPTVVNAKEDVVAATLALTEANWTANTEELNAVYNGNFALSTNDGAMAGWETDHAAGLGSAYHARAFVLTNGMNNYDQLSVFGQGDGTHSAAYFRFDGTNSAKTTTYTYGATEGYTMPLAAETNYRFTAQLGGWGQVDKDVILNIVDEAGEIVATQTVKTSTAGINAQGGIVKDVAMTFRTTEAGNFRVQLKNGNTDVDNAIVISNIELKSYILKGDINGDGSVSTADAVPVIDFVLEKSVPTAAQFKAADVNKNNELTVSDAVGIVNIALGEWDGTVATARQTTDLTGNSLTVEGTDICLVNSHEFVGFQMDITLSEDAQFNGAQLTARTANHFVDWNRVADRTWRIVVFSAGNDAISSTEGALLHLDITGDQTVTITRNEFTDAQARGYRLTSGETTGINGINAADADTRVYNAAGQQTGKLRKGMNVVLDANGKTVKVLRK